MSNQGQLQVHRTSIEGLLFLDLSVFADDRGDFTEAWQNEKMAELGLPKFSPVQMSVSHSKKGVVRGIHGEPWDKYIHIASGSIFAPITDLRPDSPTFGKVETFTLNPGNALFLPKGMGNAFQALEETAYVYLVTGLWSAELSKSGAYTAVAYNDSDIGIDWPITGDAMIVSAKDQANPTLRQAFPEKFS